MNLTVNEIQAIDDYLKESGIGYWDIRLEMTDHIASKLEDTDGSYDFEFAFKGVLKDLGWTGNLKPLERQRLLVINKITRRAYFNNVLDLFTNYKSLLAIIVAIWVYYLAYISIPFSIFKWMSLLFFGVPVLYFTLHSIRTYLKIKKVGYLTYGYFYICFSILMTNGLYQLFRPDGLFEVTRETSHAILIITTIINVIFVISGIKIYLKYYNQYKELYLKLSLDNK